MHCCHHVVIAHYWNMYINTCKRYDKIWSQVLESDDLRRNRDVKSFYRNEKHRVCASSKLYTNGARRLSLFPPDLPREISPPRGLWWSLRRPERTGAKRVADRGNIGSPHWITSGEAIFRKSESNVTWRGESEGIDVETVMSNRYFYISTNILLKPPKNVSESGRRAQRVHAIALNFISFFAVVIPR